MSRIRNTVAVQLAAFSVALICPAWALAEPLDFNHDVRPILSDNCFKCHGFDDAARKSKLRLDVRAMALKGGKSGDPAIVPGKPEQSELIKRIFTKDEDDVMPPTSSNKGPLKEAQKAILKRWIAEGAEYKTHWAFLAPKAAPLPAVKQKDWSRNEIDRFVLAKLEEAGLHPSPEADRYTLVRRLYLDLIGLPPTPEEADAFAHDKSADAYDKLVEKLLASPQYGERWARRWLDLARYADTNGFEKDRPRSIWPYRDWVIKAFNNDMPYDQFTIEQLAGDMLPNATVDQKVATGFHRNTMRNEEGGIDPQEYRFYSVVDRTAVTGTTWLGLTVQCAQCHTHKFDPITHKDYYSLFAFFNDADEPEMDLPSPEITAKRDEIEGKIAAAKADLANQWPTNAITWRTPDALATAAGSKPEKQGDGSWRFVGPSPEKDTYTFTFDSDATRVDSIRVEALTQGKKGPGRTAHGNFVLSGISVSVQPKGGAAETQTVKLARATADFSQSNFSVEDALKNLPHGGWGISPAEKQNHAATFYFDKPVELSKGGKWTVVLQQQFGAKHTMGRVRVSVGTKQAPTGNEAQFKKTELARHFAEWEKKESAKAVKWTTLRPKSLKAKSLYLTLLDDDSILAAGDDIKSEAYDLTFGTDLKGITAVRVEALPHESLPKHGPGLIDYEGPFGDFSLTNITLAMNGTAGKFASATQSFAAGGNTAGMSIDDNLQTGWMINGGQGKAHQAVFVLANPTTGPGDLELKLFFERYFACALGHFRISVTTDPRVAQDSAMPPDVETALLTPAAQRSESEKHLLMARFLEVTPELAEARQKIDAMEKSLPNYPSTLVMNQRPAGHDRVTKIHHRGEFLSEEEAVQPDVPGILPPLPKDAPRNRLSLAKWLVSRENPLTARVAVNRQWQAFFGRGIVKTVQDFGYQGDPPTHPELLDWLAVAFMDRGWSFKELDRMIVKSATYRQSSRASEELIARDPENLLMARGPRFRVEAEIVRDAALKEAGLLSSKMYGPSVFPAQLPSITTEGTYGPLQWKISPGEDRYRRSLYTFTKRTAPFAMYNTFDAPTGEACIARREVTDTPLQALTLLNDQIFMEVAQTLGGNIARLAESDEDRARTLFRRCVTRPPAQDELTALVGFVKDQRTRFSAKELDPAKISGAAGNDAVERATWTTAARAVLNLDEAVTKD